MRPVQRHKVFAEPSPVATLGDGGNGCDRPTRQREVVQDAFGFVVNGLLDGPRAKDVIRRRGVIQKVVNTDASLTRSRTVRGRGGNYKVFVTVHRKSLPFGLLPRRAKNTPTNVYRPNGLSYGTRCALFAHFPTIRRFDPNRHRVVVFSGQFSKFASGLSSFARTFQGVA